MGGAACCSRPRLTLMVCGVSCAHGPAGVPCSRLLQQLGAHWSVVRLARSSPAPACVRVLCVTCMVGMCGLLSRGWVGPKPSATLLTGCTWGSAQVVAVWVLHVFQCGEDGQWWAWCSALCNPSLRWLGTPSASRAMCCGQVFDHLL
jgi:hypothetical protein